MEERQTVIIGGGLMGAALAWGLAGLGHEVLVLDGGDLDPRASRANLGLVWVSDKGLDQPHYALWSRDAARQWPTFAAQLQAQTGIDVQLRQPGGFNFALSHGEFEQLSNRMARIAEQTQGALADYEVLYAAQLRQRLPGLGREVVGATFCPLDGHVNSLRLLRALHHGMRMRGVHYRAGHPVTQVRPQGQAFVLDGPWGQVKATKVILAAGIDNTRLAPMVGLAAPLVRSKGQIIVTEKCQPFFAQVAGTLRQSAEGSVLIGESQETDSGSLGINHEISTVLADRAARIFPAIAALNVVRIWTGWRVKTADGMPLYEQSAAHPGAFVMLAHSGVTLSSLHALQLPAQIAAGALSEVLRPFDSRRLHVS